MKWLLYSLVPNVTTGWFIWNFVAKNVSHKTRVYCNTIFTSRRLCLTLVWLVVVLQKTVVF